MANQSSVFPIYLRAEYRSDGQGFARFQSDAQRAAMAAKREFEGVRTALDAALSRPRNAGGSLDLGVDELKRAALAQQQIAAAAREVANATRAAATANGQFDASLSRSTRAAFELANAEERVSRELMEQVAALEAVQRELNQTASAADLVTAANRRGTTANQNVINSQRASRTAFIQLGQQMQDVAVQAQLGTSAFLIFGQQVPQAAFALSGLADSANRTQRAIGAVATFLSGPWGAAIFVAIAALGPFVAKLFESEDAADASSRAQRSLTQVLADSTSSYDELTKALRDYNREQERGQQTTLNTLKAQAAQIASNLETAASIRQKIKAELELFQAEVRRGPTGPGGQGQIGALAAASVLSGNLAQQDALIKELQAGARNTNVQLAVEFAKINTDSAARINATYDDLAEKAKKRITDLNTLTARLTEIEQGRNAALEADRASNRKTPQDRSAERRLREVEGLAAFGERAEDRIARINDRFSEQTRLVTQSLQANRELDTIIDETNRKMRLAKNLTADQRREFEGIIAAAEATRDTIDAALLRPFEDLKRESEERLQIEQLLAQGRIDEAAGLQAVLQLQRQIGTEAELRAALERAITEDKATEAERIRNLLANYNQLMDGVRDRVIAEQQITRELRDQQAVFNAQLDVVDQVQRSLTDLLSGRTTNFFKDFRQALRDLQGQRLFEDIFGETFRSIREELQANTPLGRANKALADEATKTTGTVTRLEQSLDGLSDAVSRTRDRLLSDFDSEFGAANDNGGFSPRFAIVEAAMRAIGQDPYGIRVPGQKPTETGITRRSITDLAKLISSGVGSSIAALFKDVLGERFAQVLGDTIGGFIAGKTLGGTTGGILGALQGSLGLFADKDGKLSKGLQGLSDALGEAGAGAAIGTQVAGIGKAFGLKGSTTGAQIGGAIGTFVPIPGGQIIGAIVGNIVGGLLKSTPRASATIGGVGGSLGVTGVRGNKAGLRDAAGGLGEDVIGSITRIAEQLGASVDASRGSVSIGQRGKNLRVDTSGRGITKTRKGALDFGENAEAAIAAAVRDLIQDGVIKGLKASENRLLQAAKDVESGLRDVLTFRGVLDRLREVKDPIGFAVDQVAREFDGFRDLFKRAGADAAEFAQLEELAGIERARAIEEATDRVAGSLRSLLDSLRLGDSGLSLRARQGNAASRFDALAARVAAGDSSAFDDFAEVSQQLLDIERQLFGSTQAYFDRLNQITALTERAIADQTNVTSIGALAPSPLGDTVVIDRSINTMNDNLGAKLDRLNDNLVTALNPALRPVITGGGGGRSDLTSYPAFIANF